LRSNFRGVGNFHLAPLNQAIVDDTTADLLKLSLHFDSGIDAMTVVSTDISPRQARDLAIHLWVPTGLSGLVRATLAALGPTRPLHGAAARQRQPATWRRLGPPGNSQLPELVRAG